MTTVPVGPHTLLKQPPSERILLLAQSGDPRAMRELYEWYQKLWYILGGLQGVSWDVVDKTGSELTDIETRPHSMLQSVLGWSSGADIEQVRHISNAQGKVWQDHVEVVNGNPHGTDHDMLDGLSDDDHAQYLLLAGRAGQRVVTPLVLGTAIDNTTIEADGTIKFNGAATVWKDIKFPMAPPKTTGAGNPTLVTFNGGLRGYSFAVNDAHDFNAEEIDHDAKIGSTATWHVHFLNRSNDGTNRAVKWQIEYALEPAAGALPAPTTISAEIVIPAGTPVNTPMRLDVNTFVIAGIAQLAYARISRIAASIAAPSTDPVLGALHFHYELDTMGSRQIITK